MAPTISPIPDQEPISSKKRVSARGRLRTYFLTGVIVAGPLAITIYITWWIIALIDGWVKPLVPAIYLPDHYLPFSVPGLGLVIAFVVLTLLGFLTANLVGRSVVEFGEVLLARTPVISGLYRGLRQIFETLFSANGTSFRTVGLVQFPVKGTWSVVFLSAPAGAEVQAALSSRDDAGESRRRGETPERDATGSPAAETGPGLDHGHSHGQDTGAGADYVGVFLPCAPNPTTGFFFYLPRSEIIELSISIDDAAKLVMSAGVIQPEDPQGRLQTMAASLRSAHEQEARAGQEADDEKARREPARQNA